MQERVYHSDNSTKINSEWARLGGKSYRLTDISSVKVCSTQTDRARNLPSILIVIGSLLMFSVINLQNVYPVEWDGFEPAAYALGILIALSGLTILVIQMVLKSEYIYMVNIEGTFGAACPFASDDEHYVRKVATALQTALQDRKVQPASQPLAELRDARQS